MSVAKALQIGMAAYDSTFDLGEQGVLSSTWGGGSRIDMTIGAKIIEVIEKDSLLHNATIMGKNLQEALKDLSQKQSNKIVDVRGIGLMVGIEFETKQRRDTVLVQAFKKGLLLLPAGQKAMRIIPPLIIKDEEIQEGLELIEEALAI